MKRFPKLVITLVLLAMVIGIFAAMPVSAAAEYKAITLKTEQLTAGHYTNTALTGEIVQHSANKNYKEEIGCMIDNDNKGAYWSKPYKFSALKDNGGSTVPVVLINVANGGEGVTIAGFEMMLRSAFDCQILHFELQATTSADSDKWISILDKKLTVESWDSRKLRFEFPEVTVYKFRLLAYDIAEPDIAKDDYKDYQVCLGDETRFTLAEIDLLQKKEAASDSGNSSTTKPTTSVQATTRPAIGIQIPTKAPTTGGQTATKAPTQPATQAPTQPATQAPTTGGQTATKAPTQPATQAPTTGGQTATKAPTQPATQAPTTDITVTEPTVDPSAPTVEPTVDPSAPTDATVDPSAPTEETVDPSAPTDATEPDATDATEPDATDATEPNATEATEPQETTPDTNDGDGDQGPDNTVFIIIGVACAAAVLIAAGVVFFIIKKKKSA